MCAWACSGVWARGGGGSQYDMKNHGSCVQSAHNSLLKQIQLQLASFRDRKTQTIMLGASQLYFAAQKCVSGQTCLFSDTIRPSEHSRDEQRLSWLSWLQGCQRHRVAAAVAGSPRVSTSNFARSPIAYKWISSRGFQENSRKQVP